MEHHFNVQIAQKYGIEESILIHHLCFWIHKNVANQKHCLYGRYWTYSTAQAYSLLFPYMSESKIYRVLKSLEDKGIIIKGNFNEDKRSRTNWFTFTDDALTILSQAGYDIKGFSLSLQNKEMQFAESQNATYENADSNNIYNTKTDNKQKKEKINISQKKSDVNYQDIFDCWNKHNGATWGKVTSFTDKRKRAIKNLIVSHNITDVDLCHVFTSLPYADDWLFHPTGQHKTWKPTFDWWIANTGSWFTRALEGGVHTNNPQAFKDIMEGNAVSAYHPQQSPSLAWDENNKVYIYIGFFDGRFIPDGYNDDNRPDGARVMLNNSRGIIVWSKTERKWITEKEKL